MNYSGNVNELFEALTNAQAEMPVIPMDSTNPFFKSRYASLGSVINATRDVLKKHGLAVTQLVISEENRIGIETVLAHSSGQWISSRAFVTLEGASNPAQEAGKVITYLRRYSLSAVLGVYADEDTDAHQPTQAQHKPAQQQQTPQQQPQSGEYVRTPEEVRDWMKQAVKAHAGKVASKAQRGLVAGLFSEIFAGDDTARHASQHYLFGEESLNDLKDHTIIMLLNDWLRPVKDTGGAYIPDETAVKELRRIVDQVAVDQGQQNMEF